MFQYFYRIYDKYQRPTTAFAILTDRNKGFRPQQFEQQYLGTSIRYSFNLYKLLDQQEELLLESHNPFAMAVLTALVALKKGKVTEDELFSGKIYLAKRLLEREFSKDKIRALMNFLKLYVRFGDVEKSHKFEKEIEILTNKTKKTMGIEEFVLERAERIGEKRGLAKGEKRGIEKGIEKGIEAKTEQFVRTLILQTDFDDAKIASLTDAPVETVQKLRQK